MATQWLRRAWLAAAGASVLLLAACGGGDVESTIAPERLIVFGDAMADIGQNAGGTKYTVNDGGTNNWTMVVAEGFGLRVEPARVGGLSFAQGNSRVAATPGAGNDPAAPSVVSQIDAFLAASSLRATDLVLINAGHSDVIVEGRAAVDGVQSASDAVQNAGDAGTELGKQVRRLLDAGAQRVVVFAAYNLGRSPWASRVNSESLLEAVSAEFNNQFKVEVAAFGDRVLYVDFAQQINVYEGNPGNHGFGNVDEAVCTSIDAGPGIGVGTGRPDSSECTTATLRDSNYDAYLFADEVYVTPRAHRLLGEFALARIRDRW